MKALMRRLKAELPSVDNDFVNRNTFSMALTSFHTSVSNIWSQARLNHDLRVLIRVLLKAQLRPVSFQRYIEKCNPVTPQEELSTLDTDEAESVATEEDVPTTYDATLTDRKWGNMYKQFCTDIALRLCATTLAKRQSALELLEKLRLASEDIPMEEDPETGAGDDQEKEEEPNNIEDDDNDDEPEFEDFCEQGNTTVPATQETSMSKIRSLLAVATSLVQAPALQHAVTATYIKKQVYSSVTITDNEAEVTAHIVNTLRPLVPKTPKGGKPDCSVFTLAPLATITSKVLTACGLSKQTWKMFPEPKAKISLPLNAHCLYAILSDEYTLYSDHVPITSLDMLSLHKDTMLDSIFKTPSIERILQERGGYSFDKSMMYNNRWSIQWLGSKIVWSAKTKKKTETANVHKPSDIKEQITELTTQVNQLANELTAANVALAEAEMTRAIWTTIMKDDDSTFLERTDALQNIPDAKENVDAAWIHMDAVREELLTAKQQLYTLNKIDRGQPLPKGQAPQV